MDEHSRITEEDYIVDSIATLALGKLRANAWKRHWDNCSLEELFKLAQQEMDELLEAIDKGDISAIRLEAGDVTAFMAMIAARAISRVKESLQ